MRYPFRHTQTSNSLWRSRLLEYGGQYFDLNTFPEGKAKTALQRIINKKMGKRFDEVSGPVANRKQKKKRKLGQKPVSGPALVQEPVSGPAAGREAVSGLVDSFKALELSNHRDTVLRLRKT